MVQRFKGCNHYLKLIEIVKIKMLKIIFIISINFMKNDFQPMNL